MSMKSSVILAASVFEMSYIKQTNKQTNKPTHHCWIPHQCNCCWHG